MIDFLMKLVVWLFCAVMIIAPIFFIFIGINLGEKNYIWLGCIFVVVEIFAAFFFHGLNDRGKSDKEDDK